MTAIAARARGLVTTVLSADALAGLDRARDAHALAAIAGVAEPEAIEHAVRDRAHADLATLARWSDALAPLELDEDRRSLRAIVRGLAAGASARRKLAGAVPTARLPTRALAALAGASSLPELVDLLGDHPLAPALAQPRLDPLELELALARRFGELARTRDRALRTYLAQVIDVENAIAALLLAERGRGYAADAAFVAGGGLIARATFAAAASAPPRVIERPAPGFDPGPVDAARARLARAFAKTPVARALYAAEPAAIDEAALAWQLATQAQLRRLQPLGLAPAIYAVLRRREEARHLRAAAWRLALAGAP